MDVRFERPGDEEGIHAVHLACFPTHGEAELVRDLRAAGRLAVSVVAVEDGVVTSHVAFSPVTLHRTAEGSSGRPDRAGGPSGLSGIGLAPVGTHPDFRRRGLAAALIRAGLERCAMRGHGFVVVLGDPAYYGRFGFQPAARWRLVDEYEGGAAFQALELRDGAIPAAGGLVRYAPEFSRFDAG